MPNTDSAARSRSHSAEYAVAIPLLGVCLIIGLAFWLLKPGGTASAPAGKLQAAAGANPSQQSDESAAVESWKQKLEGELSQAEQERRKKEQQDTDQANEKAKAAKELELATEKAKAVAAKETERPKSSIAAKAAEPSSPPPPPQLAHAEPTAPAQTQPVIKAARIDWSSCDRPKYPLLSEDQHEEGTVEVAVEVDAKGHYQSGSISKSSGSYRLDQAAANAIAKCHFTPGTVDNVPFAGQSLVKFTWKLS